MKAKTRKKSPANTAPRGRLRHSIKFRLRCDLVRLCSADRWPITLSFSSPPGSPFIGLLRLTPHSARGRGECATFDRGDVASLDLGGNIFRARIACKAKDDGEILVHAFDVFNVLVRPVFLKTNALAEQGRR